MKVMYPRCAGIDIHKKNMTVCRFIDRGAGETPELETRRFPTHPQGISEMADWLREAQGERDRHGSYWRVLETSVERLGRESGTASM
jgi:transposase